MFSGKTKASTEGIRCISEILHSVYFTAIPRPGKMFTTQKTASQILKGIRFSLKVTVDRIMPEDFNALVTELKKRTVALECPDFEGDCYCDNIPGDLKQANFNGVRYGVSFTLVAKSLITDGDGL